MDTAIPVVSASDRQVPVRILSSTKRVVFVLVQPTQYKNDTNGQYEADGFPHRYWRVTVPSNSVGVVYGVTMHALEQLQLPIPVEVYVFEDRIWAHAKAMRELYERFPEEGTQLIVGFVSVQTGQFPRAYDLIKFWQAVGAQCVIGGFHVSGSISTMYDGIVDPQRPNIPSPHIMPAEIQEFMDNGVIIFHGEAEEVWKQTIVDILEGHPQQLYRGGLPDLSKAPLPLYPQAYFKSSFATDAQCIDTSRGCPFACSFCTIINVQGRKSRSRTPADVIEYVKAICEREGKASIFFTDDNFARNKEWQEILAGIIALREAGYRISIMDEADLAAHRIPNFIQMFADAGGDQMFMGVESMSAANLAEVNKVQNNVNAYEEIWRTCHEHEIMVHAGYIIGFEHDTPESVDRDVDELHRRGVDFASFFIKTPLPGSEDHARAVAAGVAIDPDFSKVDSFHAIVDHPCMTRAQWEETYRRAWKRFYTVPNMITALKRFKTREARLKLLRYQFWARWSFAVEKTHPMIGGFYRVRSYRDRQASAPSLSFPRYVAEEVWRHLRYVGYLFSEFYRFQHVYFEAELAPASMTTRRRELRGKLHGIGDWLKRTFAKRPSRQWLNAFWVRYGRKRWHLLVNPLAYHWHLRMLPYAATEVVYTVRFMTKLPELVKDTIK